MRPIRDISEVHPDGVLYHSAFGFAKVVAVGEAGVHLAWEHPGENLPEVVSAGNLARVYARCVEGGFFHRAMVDPQDLLPSPGNGVGPRLRTTFPEVGADSVIMVARDMHVAAGFQRHILSAGFVGKGTSRSEGASQRFACRRRGLAGQYGQLPVLACPQF